MSRRKVNTLEELGVGRDSGGVYCFLPYDNLDNHNKAVFKIGMSKNFRKRFEVYHTSYPNGFYYVAILENPRENKLIETKGKDKGKELSLRKYYFQVEIFIKYKILQKKGHLITSTARIKHLNDLKRGETEWIYTDVDTIHEAFEEASKKFGGNLHLGNLDTLKHVDKRNTYKAEIYYPIKADNSTIFSRFFNHLSKFVTNIIPNP